MIPDDLAEDLEPLFERAEREDLMFWNRLYNLWFTPHELRIHQALGEYRWGSVNWELRKHPDKDDLH